MSVTPKSKTKIKTTLKIDRKLWAEVKKKATLLGTDTNEVVEVAVKLLLVILNKRKIPDELGYMLVDTDEVLLDKLSDWVIGQ